MYPDESSLTTFTVLWAALGLGLYVWYLAALAVLFPRIGLPAGAGWIPVWNESRILQRGGFSPWLALLMLVPGVSIIFVVLRIIAIHRIHTELGKGAGMTVLALIVPPVWATLLASQLRDTRDGQAPGPLRTGSIFVSAPTAPAEVAAPSPWAAPPAVPLSERPVAPAAHATRAAPGAPAFSDAFSGAGPSAGPSAGSDTGTATPWGFGRETEDAYQQLSTQEVQPLSLPFNAERSAEPFTWPGTIDEASRTPRVAAPFAVPESAWAAPVAAPPPAPTPIPLAPAAFTAPAAPPPDPGVDAGADDQLDRKFGAELDDDLDRTIFVRRAPGERWVVELPDGSQLPLPSNDVIVGRRPTETADSSVLVIPDPTRTLSKSHVRLHVIDGAWAVTDLNSTNGLAVVDEHGEEEPVAAGVSEPATEEMIFGTLRVRLRLVATDG